MTLILIGGYCFICDKELDKEQANQHQHKKEGK